MTTITVRRNFSSSHERLRRARKLYYRLISTAVFAQPESLVFFAHRAQSAGLFSQKNSIRDICFSILFGVCKSRPTGKEKRDYLYKTGRHIAFDHAKYWRKDGDKIKVIQKPRVRIMLNTQEAA